MEDPTSKGRHELNLASRKAEEAAWRRFQATQWLDSLVGSLGISTQPTEREFISCLRNGLVLCNVINKIQPGSVPKVVEIHSASQVPTWDSQPLPAYQYFENVRNFLVAVEELKLPAFEASDLERDNLEVGSSAKVVDCILALKAYHEWKQISGGHGFFKPPRSPMVMHSASRNHPRASGAISSDACRKLDMSTACNSLPPPESGTQNIEDSIAKAIAECMVDSKENIDDNILTSFRNGSTDPIKLFGSILSKCLDKQLQNKLPEMKPIFKDLLGGESPLTHSTSTPLGNLDNKHCRACLTKDSCNHWNLFQMQEKELSNLKELLSKTKSEFEDLQSQLQRDLKQLGSQVKEMSSAALGYHKVVKENRNLYNMVQDLKGNIRVYCRIRPAFSAEAKNVVDFIGEDGSLVVLDPLKPQKDGRKNFQFNRVFGHTATQEEIFKDTQPLIRSVMDGYNVCIFAYGQTGSGKTHTMCGPSGGSTKDMGINYLALNDLFQLSNKRTDTVKYDIHVQMVEIYNEQVRDLLAEDSTTKLEIRSCDSGPSVPDATMHSVKSTSDVLSLMKLGEVNRVVSSTAINNQSSRSHSILTVLVHGKDVSGSIIRSCLHLVDLAGSERVAKSEVTGDGLKEAQYINKSLSCLGDVIAALAQKSSYIPYRNSKLTLLLQNSLGGHAKTLMFAHVSPEADSFGETISTLKFAQRASTVELGAAHMNKESTEVKALNEQSLKKVNKEAQNVQPNVPNSPLGKQAVNEQTPPRSRRLSIENCRTMEKEKPHSIPERTPPRPRRLSTENCNTMKKLKLTMNNEEIPETGSKSGEQRAPRSPTSAVYSSQVLKTDGREKIPPLELPKTPEPQPTLARNEVQIMTSSTNGKGSQIRIPVRTIGKLINGSDKRLRTPMFHDPQLGHLPPELLIPIVAELPPKDRLEVLVSSKEVFDLLIDRRERWASTKPLGTAKDEESFRLNLLPVLRSLNKINDGNFDFLEFPRGTTFFDFSQAMMLSRVTLKGRRVTLKGLGLPEWPNYTWTTVSVCFDYVRGISLLKVPGAILQRDQFVKAITVHNNGIKTLIVYRCIIDIKVAEYISKYFKELEELRVSKYCILTGNGILHVLKNIRTLKRFDMSGCGCHGLTDTILKEGERLDVFSHDSVDNACGACQQDLASEWFLAWCTHKAASPEQVFPLDRLPTRAYSD